MIRERLLLPDEPPAPAQSAPVETPGHSGPYRGTVPVRVLPPGVMSGDDSAPKWGPSGAKGLAVQRRNRAQAKASAPSFHFGSGRRIPSPAPEIGPQNGKGGAPAPKRGRRSKWE